MNMQMITRGWLVLRLENDSPSALTWAMVSFAAPMAIVSLLCGALSDRIPKKYLIIGSQLGNAALTLIVGLMDATGTIWLGALMVLGVLNGSMFALNMPSRQAIISEIVPRDRVMNAVALNNTSMNLTRAFGPALAGILIAFFSTALVFYIVSIVYVFSALSVVRLKNTVIMPASARKSVMADIKEGLRYALGDPTLRGLIIMAFLPALFGFTLFALMPAWAREALNVTSFDLGYLMAVMGIGALFGTLGLASMRNLSGRGMILLVISTFWGLSIIGVAFAAEFVSAIFFLIVYGLLRLIVHVTEHDSVPNIRRPREARTRDEPVHDDFRADAHRRNSIRRVRGGSRHSAVAKHKRVRADCPHAHIRLRIPTLPQNSITSRLFPAISAVALGTEWQSNPFVLSLPSYPPINSIPSILPTLSIDIGPPVQ